MIAHSEKEQAAPTWKKTFGFHPADRLGRPRRRRERGAARRSCCGPGTPGSNTAADHIEATRLALAQLPRRLRRRVLVRTDSGGGTHGFLNWLTAPSRRLHYSVGMTITEDMQAAILKVPATRVDARLTTATGRSATAPGSRTSPACSTCRPGRPGCGSSSARSGRTPARSCGSPTSTGTGSPPSPPTRSKGQLADLELRHRRRARCEDRIRCAKDTGLRNLPLKGFAQNQVWCEIVALACELLAWTQMLALTGTARRWEPKRLRLRLFSVAGRLARGGRRLRLRLAERWPWAGEITAAVTRLQALPSG